MIDNLRVDSRSSGKAFVDPHAARMWFLQNFPLQQTASVAVDTTLDESVAILFVDATAAARTVTLPPVLSAPPWPFTVVKTDVSVNTVTIDGDGAETVNGATEVLAAQYDSATVAHDGTEWFVISRS